LAATTTTTKDNATMSTDKAKVDNAGPKIETTSTPKTAGKTKKVEGTFAEAWKPGAEGEVLAGIYLGSQDAVGKRGPFKAYHIKDSAGKRWSVSGASLNTIMPQVPRKTPVTIVYLGTEAMDKGDMKTFDVQIPADVDLIDPMDNDDD
jgi:hypothetical protein